jgi:hypothetical protein
MEDQHRTLKNKELKEIRPAGGGVKMRSKNPALPKPKQQEPRVMQNVQPPPNTSAENLEPPTEEAARLISQINNAKQALIEAMRGFSRLLGDLTLPENRSERGKQEETLIINELIRSVQAVEQLERGEGLMSLCVFATRLSLSLRNTSNKLSHKIYILEKRIEQLEKATGIEFPKEDPKAKEKQLLIEQAEKLGIKINIES